MAGEFTRLINSRASLIGIAIGAAYGLFARLVVTMKMGVELLPEMTLAFLLLVPIGIGILTVAQSDNRSFGYRFFAPWAPMSLTLAATAVLGWEGAICIYLAIPVVFPLSSIGGLIGGMFRRRTFAAQSVILAAPFILGPIEGRVANPEKIVVTTQQILIDAPPSIVWPLVASVDSIKPEEQRPALFLSMGFPRPISATLNRPGVGGIRRARFARGLVFTETVIVWIPDRVLSFTIEPNTDSIPATTLDEHVTIGGPYFDVLTGTYELEPVERGRKTLLTLQSRHRVSTHFNIYAGWWAERIMTSIQRNILLVHKQRAERIEARLVSRCSLLDTRFSRSLRATRYAPEPACREKRVASAKGEQREASSGLYLIDQ